MSNLLSQASLVMIPSGYKEDVVYSQIPTSGAGDLSFTRASNGTRVNSAGLVEVTPWNLCDYSEDQTQWTSQNATTVTANSTTAPNGTTTADTVTPTAVNDDHYRGIVLSSQVGELTAFIYVKPNGYNFFDWGIYNGSQYIVRATFDLVNLTYTFTNAGTATIESVGNGWLKCGISGTNASLTTMSLYYRSRPTGGTGAFTGNGTSGAFIWGAQLNIGSTAKPYFPTTDRLNVPRLTYQNGGGGCPSLLLEKQSSNVILYSEQFDETNWLKGNISVTANQTTSPDGTQNADKITNTTISAVYLYQKSQISASTWSYSFYAKKGTNKYLGISLCSETYQATSRYQPVFDLDNGTLQTINQSGSNETNTSYSINAVGNGWYKITASFTLSAGADFTFIVFSSSNNTSYNPASGNLDWSNATIGDYYLWGVQGEASSYPTSYIPTTSSSATRVADVVQKTGISSLIGQTEGVLFVDINYISHEAQSILAIEDWVANSTVIRILADTSTSLGAQVFQGGNQYIATFNSAVNGQRYKCALAYKANDFAFYVNGTQVSTSSSGTVPTNANVRFGAFLSGQTMDGQINQMALFKTRLTNAELASLTTI